MQTDEGGSTPDAAPQHDPYAKGGDWPIERLVEDWALDPAALRRTLNFAAHSARLAQPPADEASSADLDAIANAAAKLVAALESASIGSVTNVMLRNLDLHPGDVLNHPEAHRTQIVNCVRWLRTRSRQAARQLKTLQTKPGGKSRFKESRRAHTGPRARPSERERSVIYILARLWRETHGKWPGYYKAADGLKKPNRGARFVLAVSKEFFEILLPGQRLRSVLGSLNLPANET